MNFIFFIIDSNSQWKLFAGINIVHVFNDLKVILKTNTDSIIN